MKRPASPNVILLYPKTGMDFGSTVAPPHALLAIAAPLASAGYEVCVLDQRTQPINEQLLANLISNDLLCLGISTMTGTQIKHALTLAATARKLTAGRIPIVWGGCHPTILPEQTLAHENVDIVVIGEADQTFLELVQALEHKRHLQGVKGIMYKNGTERVKTDSRPLLDMEALLPVPWDMIDVEKYIHRDIFLRECYRVLDLGQTSRGCPFKCGFCSSATIRGRKWRPMSVEKSLDKIVDGARRFKLDGFWLRDDEFYIDRQRAHLICEGIIRENLGVRFYTSTRVDVFLKATDDQLRTLKRAGAHTLKFGAESGSQRILNLMDKGITPDQTLAANRRCKEHGLIPAYTLVIGYPTETFADIDATIDLVYRLKRENPEAQFDTITTFTPFPGSPSFDLAIQHGLKPPTSLEAWSGWLFDDYDFDGHKLPWFSPKERMYVGNITFMSILANALANVLGSSESKVWRAMAKTVAYPTSFYFRERLKRKMYRNVPELAMVRFLRSKLLYGKR